MKIIRYKKNPILTKDDFIPLNENLNVLLAFNPGVTTYNNETILIVRIAVNAKEKEGFVGVPIYNEEKNVIDLKYFSLSDSSCDFSDKRFVRQNGNLYLTTLSYFAYASSKDGINFEVRKTPFMIGDNSYEAFGIEDARVTKLGSYYYINYSGVSKDGICTMLARTKDFIEVEKLGPIFMPDNKDVVIFPKKIKGEYVVLSRPESAYFRRPNIWMSYSKDLLSWGKHKMFMTLKESSFDSARIGASCVPFLTKYGWMLIYHGATKDDKYCLGAALLDKDDPSKIIYRSEKALMIPEAKYEVNGFMPNVIFACGCNQKGNTIHLYYGATDEKICYAKMKVTDIIEFLKEE